MSRQQMPGALPSEGCKNCNPHEKCPQCEYLVENGGQCGGCHVFFLNEDFEYRISEVNKT